MVEVVPADKFSRLPERYQRRAREIAHRVTEIDALGMPASVDEIGAELMRLRGQLRPQPDIEDRDMASGFREALRDLPAWAIAEATNDYLSGRVENHTGQFMPSCAEFAKRARSILMPFLSERAALKSEASKLVERAEDERRRLVIEAERADPAVRQRASEIMERARVGAKDAITYPQRGVSEDASKRLDAYRRPREFVSKLDQTPIVKAGKSPKSMQE